MTQQFCDLNFEQLEDGTVRLEQKDYCGESAFIDAHPQQLAFIVRRVCGMSEATATTIEDLERKLAVLTDRLERLVTDDWFRKAIIDGCPDFAEILARLDGLVDLAIEMDGGRLLPSDPVPDKKPPAPKRFPTPTPPASHRQPDMLNP
jgi:hypothetical protein